MRPLSQYYARRLLEVVCDNKTSPADKDHVDRDVWARTLPPVRGLNFRDRETAACCLRAGGLGAVPSNSPSLPDSQPRALPPVPSSNQQQIPRAESHQSKSTLSSASSFGKIPHPLTGDSPNLNLPPVRSVPVTEYQELGDEPLIPIPQVPNDPDDEFDDSSPSRLFSEIGPSVSVAKGIDGKKLKHTSQQPAEYFEFVHHNPFPEHGSYHRHGTESEDNSMSSPPQSFESQPKTVSSLPSTATSLPLPPLPSFALERNNLSGNKVTHTQFQPNSMPIPPPPPPLHTVQSYGSAPAVPPPPSPPPPRIDEKRARRDTEDSSPVTGSELCDFNEDIRDEFSDLADSSVPSIRADWIHGYAQPPTTVVEDDDDLDVGLGARPVESDEEDEYVHGVHVMVDRNMVGRRSEPLQG